MIHEMKNYELFTVLLIKLNFSICLAANCVVFVDIRQQPKTISTHVGNCNASHRFIIAVKLSNANQNCVVNKSAMTTFFFLIYFGLSMTNLSQLIS